MRILIVDNDFKLPASPTGSEHLGRPLQSKDCRSLLSNKRESALNLRSFSARGCVVEAGPAQRERL